MGVTALPVTSISAGGGERVVHVVANVTLSVAGRGIVGARVQDAGDFGEIHGILVSVGVV